VRTRAPRTRRPVNTENNARGACPYPRSCGGILQSGPGDVSADDCACAPRQCTVRPAVYLTNPTNRLIAGSRASRLSRPARDVCNPIGRALGGGAITVAPSSCSDHPGLTHVLIRFGCGTLVPTGCSSHCK
jgi:hypothetical protein